MRTLLTALGIAIIVFAAVLMAAFSRGVQMRLAATGEAQNLLVISRKGENIIFSAIEADEVVQLQSLPGLAETLEGQPLVSPEVMDVAPAVVEVDGRKFRSPANIRGVQAIAYQVHPRIRVTEGRLPEQSNEILVGASAHARLGAPPGALDLGRTLRVYNKEWTVCGKFAAEGTLFESEIWADLNQLQTELRRRSYSLVVVRMNSPADVTAALPQFAKAGSLERYFKAWSEEAYYVHYLASLGWVYWLTLALAAAVTLAGVLIGVNTMYTAILNRVREIATQRVLGFSRFTILRGLIFESLIIALVGGVAGVAAGLLLNDYQFRLSQGVFRVVVDPLVMGGGLAQALLIGLLGALIPAAKGLRMGIVDGLRFGRGM